MTKPIFTNKSTMTWIQPDGVGNEFELFACHALTNWSQDYDDPVYVKCKSADEYGKKVIVETIPGDVNEPTFTVVAWTNRELDTLLELECPTDFQVYYGACSVPGDPEGYTKIRHFYQASKNTQSEENLDFIGDEDYGGIQLSTDWTGEAIITIVKVSVVRSNTGITETQGLNDIAMLEDGRCEGDCGAAIKDCYWGVAVANAAYGVATANVWYTQNGAASWTICATDPFADTNAHVSSCVILAGETAPRIVVCRGNVSTSYGARFSVSDDWGDTWTEVDGGGTAGCCYVNAMYKYSAGFLWAVGNGGYVYYSQDRGNSWTQIAPTTTGTTEELWDIHSSDGEILYAVGDNNTVIRTVDQGTSWSDVTGPASADTYNLYTVQVDSSYRAIVGGQIDANSECLWITNDAGENWTASAFQGSTTASTAVRRVRNAKPGMKQHKVLIHGTESVSTRYGLGSDFYFFRTLNGGGSWERKNLVTNNGLNGLYVCDINVALACGQANAIAGIADVQKMRPS